jgi:hypothetical protein
MSDQVHPFLAARVRIYVRPALCLALVCGLSACQGHQPEQTNRRSRPFSTRALDSLTTAFLVQAHDSMNTNGSGEIYSDSLVRQFTRAVQAQGVDTTLYFRSGCSGCAILVTKGEEECSCNTSEQHSYFYWQRYGRTFVKQLDCCRNHPARPTTSTAFDFYWQHGQVLEEGPRFYREFNRYNQAHPDRRRFIPRGPIHDLDVSEVRLTVGAHVLEFVVWGGEYDVAGTPLFLDYPWRRKQWEWVKRLDQLPTAFSTPQGRSQ